MIVFCALFALIFFRLSYWQYERHQAKLKIIQQLEERITQPPKALSSLSAAEKADPSFRKVIIEGTYDYSYEMILRNRKQGKSAGAHILTPLTMTDGQTIIVNRGFAPLEFASKDSRIKLHRPTSARFVGLLKEAQQKSFLAPSDPATGPGKPWVDAWLRPDIKGMQAQIATPLLPFYAEVIGDPNDTELESKIIQAKSEKAEIFMPTEQIYNLVDVEESFDPSHYPLPAFDPVVPPGRHLGYIFEWGAMGICTLLIGIILCLRPPKKIAASLMIFIALFSASGCSLDSKQSVMVASYYGRGFHGQPTANGEKFNSFEYTAAHKTLPFGTVLKLTNPANNKSCLVRINDRGPFILGRDIDISEQAAYELGIIKQGVAELIVEQ